jgi:hypothetical protein
MYLDTVPVKVVKHETDYHFVLLDRGRLGRVRDWQKQQPRPVGPNELQHGVHPLRGADCARGNYNKILFFVNIKLVPVLMLYRN